MKTLRDLLPKGILTLTFMLLGVGSTFANESTTYAPDPVDWSGSDRRFRVTTQKAPNEKGFNTMAGVGAKPSRAELAKMEQSQPAAAPSTITRAALSNTDRQFLQTAVQDGVKDVHMAEMATQKARHGDVKKLGSRIVAERSKVTNQLMGIAVKNGIKPAILSGAATMSKKDLENFDQAWLGIMAREQQKDIAMFSRHAQAGQDPELKAFLGQALPMLQEHLRLLQSAQKKIAGTAPPSATAQVTAAQQARR